MRISAGIATADLSSSFQAAASRSAMPLRIAQVVYTLTQFPTVTGVRFSAARFHARKAGPQRAAEGVAELATQTLEAQEPR